MHPLRRFLLTALLAAIPAGHLAAQAASPVTVFVVRHAEKGPGSPDPSLTKEGKERARALERALADAGITAIFTSEFKRTQETAAPLAAKLNLQPTVLDARKPDDLVRRISALPSGSKALVVTHSNLVPLIVEKLSGQKVSDLTDADYDRLYVVTSGGSGSGSVLYLHYGEASTGSGPPMRP